MTPATKEQIKAFVEKEHFTTVIDLCEKREQAALGEYRLKRALAVINKAMEELEPFQEIQDVRHLIDHLSFSADRLGKGKLRPVYET